MHQYNYFFFFLLFIFSKLLWESGRMKQKYQRILNPSVPLAFFFLYRCKKKRKKKGFCIIYFGLRQFRSKKIGFILFMDHYLYSVRFKEFMKRDVYLSFHNKIRTVYHV